MDRVSVLKELHAEIKQVMENYQVALIHTTKRGKYEYNDQPEITEECKLYIRYAILAYGTALNLVETILREEN